MKLDFEILLDSQFPLSHPQLFCLNSFTTKVDLYDGRDLLSEALETEWTTESLSHIVNSLSGFIKRMI